jgi:ArsR family transcriptional regulator, arsenate/arsenite/antimonite-responsive transcriptional repressor / arsenate reductase (thioredoxin)
MGSSRSVIVEDDEPPAFVRLASHPVRWRLLRELVRSDRAVKELVALVGEPQNLVSYHLRLLRDGGLVTAHRSSADRRDSYYAIDLDACRAALQTAGAALHPALAPWPEPARSTPHRRASRRPRVLFLCTGNSARSQIAEALLERMSGGAVDADSAGSHPKPLHPNAVTVLRKRGVDIGSNRSKHVDEFVGHRFDTVITLCDRIREVCPPFRFEPDRVHWSVPDPSLEGPTDRATYPAFERTADELERRIGFRLHLLTNQPTKGRNAHVKR